MEGVENVCLEEHPTLAAFAIILKIYNMKYYILSGATSVSETEFVDYYYYYGPPPTQSSAARYFHSF